MAVTDKIKLQAQAARLGIPGYRQMSEAELKTAIDGAQTATTPAKGSTGVAAAKGAVANGSAPKKAATAVVKGAKGAAPAAAKPKDSAPKGAGTAPAKGSAPKGSTPAPAAKSTTQKSAPKAPAAKGEVKRPATGAKTTTAAKGATSAPKKAATAKSATAKPKATQTTQRRQDTTPAGRVAIDPKAIDWTIESNVGKSGKRQLVREALAKLKDYGKVFDKLQENAMEWYPNALNTYPDAGTPEIAADRMLKWLIARVALDYAKKTGQHNSGSRAAYGTSDATQDVRRRQIRAAAEGKAATSPKALKAALTVAKGNRPAPAAPKAAPKPVAKVSTPAKAAPKAATPPKGSGASARKPANTPVARKSASQGRRTPAGNASTSRKGGALATKG